MGLGEFLDAAAAAAQVVRGQPKGTRWLLECDLDADGLCAAAVAASALQAVGQRFTVRTSRGKDAAHYEALCREPWDALMLLDKGTSAASRLAALAGGRPVVVVDHHSVPGPASGGEVDQGRPKVVLLNPRLHGLDGSRDASGATTALALAYALAGPRAAAATANALAGAMGDWQHVGGWQGWNAEARRRGLEAGKLQERLAPRTAGLGLAGDLAQPALKLPGGLAGDRAAAAAFLASLRLDPQAAMEGLDAEQATGLVSALALRLVAEGEGERAEALVARMECDARGVPVRRRYRVADACAREGRPDAGLAWLLGDATAEPEALACLASYEAALAEGLAQARGSLRALAHVQAATIARPPYSGLVAGIAMAHEVSDKARPVCILAPRSDGALQVSLRGTHEQVAAGLDLAAAVARAASAVGSEGGGHPVAAGTVIPGDAAEAFLAQLDAALGAQAATARA